MGADKPMAVIEVVVGRQPVFDRDRDVVGYELLFRALSGDRMAAGGAGRDGDLMTAAVLFGSGSIGIVRLVADKLAFCNAGRRLLIGAEPVVLPPERTVIEVHPSITPDDEVVAGCGRLVNRGFLLALDHYTGAPGSDRLLGLASVVKIDPSTVLTADIPALMARCREAGALLVAEQVETPAQLERCKELGFDLFQGYVLSRPRVVAGRSLDASSVGRLHLAAALLQTETSAERLEDIVRAEPAMAYQLLQMAGMGADHGFRRRVRSLREALVILGWRQLQSWVAFLLLTHRGMTSQEEVVTALARARTCELLAGRVDPSLAGFAFSAGMLSAFDLLLGMPMEDILLSLPLDAELHDAVLGHDTELGRLVADVADHQLGRIDDAVRSGFHEAALHEASVSALAWAVGVSSGFATPKRATTAPDPGLPRRQAAGAVAVRRAAVR